MGTSSCVSVVVIHQGHCDLSLREPEKITVFIFNSSCLFFFFILDSGFILFFFLNCASTKIGKLEYFHLYLLINAGTKTSRVVMFR